MTKRNDPGGRNRRSFLGDMATSGGAVILAGNIGKLMAQASPDWRKQIGLELFTLGPLVRQDLEGTLAKVAEIGYKEVEPVDYGSLEPQQYRALLDRYGLSAPTTHAGATDGPDLEKQLEGQQIMGIKYTEVRAPRPAGAPGPGGFPGRGGAPGAGGPQAAGAPRGAGGAPPQRPPQTVESVKRRAEQLNKYGAIVKKFGMKILIHNHSQEFELLEGGRQTQYDVLLAETDPALVVMQLDIGWASVAGQDILQMFRKDPGRYELWHVKDATGFRNVDPKMTMAERQRAAKIVPMGQGDIDYRTIFANARLAGLKHFCIEQDGAGRESGDALADCRVAYQNLFKILS